MTDFAAIDFETANGSPSSICSVGIVIVEECRIVESIYHLIRPQPNFYHWMNVRIHGIQYSDTENVDDFPEVWAEIVPKIKGLPLVAHNSPFDENCLKAAFRRYEMEYPDYKFHCTCRASRHVHKGLLSNHKLDTVATYCGFDLKNHHHALSDAEACAAIAMKIL